MANVAQIRLLNYNGEDIGMGFNSDTGLGVGVSLDFTLPVAEVSQETEADVRIVTSHEELMSSLHMSATVEGRYAFSSAGGKVDFSKKTQYNSTSTFIVAKMVINNTVRRGKDFKLKPDLQHLLDTGQIAVFNQAFGDAFVRAHYNGGEFYAVMRITSIDSKTESSLAVSLQATLQGGIASADFKTEFNNVRNDEKKRSEFSVHYYQKGGLGREEAGVTLDVDDIKERLRNFPDAVKNHPFPYYIEVATYDTIPLPLPSKEQQEDFLLALADADAKKLQYLQARNDCEFAAEHPEYFADPPTRPVLLAMAATYLQLVNGAIEHAVRLSNGQITPPRMFDPSRLVPPVSEPEIVLRKRDVGLERSFCDWWVNKDKPGTRRNDCTLVTEIGLAAKPQLNAFDEIVDPGGDQEKTARLQGEALSRIVASFKKYDRSDHLHHGSSRGTVNSLSALPTMLPLTIKSLSFAYNEIEDIRGIEQFRALVDLDLSHNAIRSIAELGSLPALRNLQLVDNAISDLGPLGSCTSLETLDISGNDIADLTPLASCKALKDLILFGTLVDFHGVINRSGNPIMNALALRDIPGMANPLTIGNVLAVRFGVLADGQAAQFTGTATRIQMSHAFHVHLTRGGEVLDEVWTLQFVRPKAPSGSDVPLIAVGWQRPHANPHASFCLESYVDPTDPKRVSIDLTADPFFGPKVTYPTFDATVVS